MNCCGELTNCALSVSFLSEPAFANRIVTSVTRRPAFSAELHSWVAPLLDAEKATEELKHRALRVYATFYKNSARVLTVIWNRLHR